MVAICLVSHFHSQIIYWSQIWRPYLIKSINMLEKIQRQAKKWILNDYQSSSDDSTSNTANVCLRNE